MWNQIPFDDFIHDTFKINSESIQYTHSKTYFQVNTFDYYETD